MQEVRVLAPAKVNLALRVGPPRPDGFHPLETVFEALDLFDEIIVRSADELSLSIEGAPGLPADSSNLAMRAAYALRERVGRVGGGAPGAGDSVRRFGGADRPSRDSSQLPGAHMTIRKRIPVAGGMAGGSADAAGALVALNELWGCGLGADELMALGAQLGSDVPFSLLGSLALGRGRGEELTPLRCAAMHSWVLVVSDEGLSTPAVFREFDRLAGATQSGPEVGGPGGQTHVGASPCPARAEPDPTAGLRQALIGPDLASLAEHMINDLQPAALSLRPDLAATLGHIADCGVARILSGSGPTIAILAADAASADSLAARLAASLPELTILRADGPAAGAHVAGVR
ncbi:MAG: 4-(cytidine 5'-diphospho)-2-C-methyl-D-erythritol kinase [Actinomycetaceae bacterium]|nr:4-(cytidine 5'-diphospho)-2-C-methyl-D-erythritol kinase [Actinomycetaceae bacterium]